MKKLTILLTLFCTIAFAQKNASALKNCEDLFNPATHFCYDGKIYETCNGMKYDPTAYFCDSPIIRIAKCSEKKYNPLIQGCCDNTIFKLSNQRCQNNTVETKCGAKWYDFENLPNNRCNNDVIETKCGTEWYDAADKNIRCNNNIFEAKCGNSWYNTDEQECKDGNIVDASTECGTKKYNFKKLPNNRCNNDIFETKCGNGWYNATNPDLRCKNNLIIETKCGNSWYNATDTNLTCQDNVLKTKCGNNEFNSATHLCDIRDNKIYKHVKIGNQVWMTENLNYNASNSKCYDNDSHNCTTYGRLYNWATAMSVCPSGWHLPSHDEWNALHHYVGGLNDLAGKYLKAGSGWNSGGNGENKYGFTALPGGSGDTDGEFGGISDFGIWWSSSENGNANAYSRSMSFSHESTDLGSSNKYNLFSVRCVMGEVKEQRKMKIKDNHGFSDYALRGTYNHETYYTENDKDEHKEYASKRDDDDSKFGIRVGFGLYRVSTETCSSIFGCPDDGRDYGTGFGGGLVVKNLFVLKSIPYIDVSSIAEFNLFYRNTLNMKIEGYEAHLTEFALSIPIIAKLEISERTKFWHHLNFFTGFQLDIPIIESLSEKGEPINNSFGYPMNTARKFRNRSAIDYGLFYGFGYNITESVAIDMRSAGGLANFSEGEMPLIQVGFGLTFFF